MRSSSYSPHTTHYSLLQVKNILPVFALVAFVAIFLWYQWALRPIAPTSDVREVVRIPSGASVADIGMLLEEKGIIRSARAFSLHVRSNGKEKELKAGSFVLYPSQSVPELVKILRTGIAQEAVVTIPEGFTVKDIDALLAEKGLIGAGALMRCARECDFSSFGFLPVPSPLPSPAGRGENVEGYLFPDTYFVVRDEFVPKFFLERLLSTFRRNIIDALGEEVNKSGRSLHEIVTMASLIEEETRAEEERPIVSGILWKRFDAKKGLDVDAATRYILEKPTGKLTAKDLNVNSPYNTRKFRGLPPGPIANPGLKSIFAALRPKDSPYWYYLHDRGGVIHYAETNDEHNLNKWQYLRGGGSP